MTEIVTIFVPEVTVVQVAESVGGASLAQVASLIGAAIEDAIASGVTDKAPSQNAVFDALAGKQNAGSYEPAKGSDDNFVTDAEKIKLANLSGENTGDQTNISGNAGTATKLQTPHSIDGVMFDGTADIQIIAAVTHAAPEKTTLADDDEIGIRDSITGDWKKITWAEFRDMTKPTTTEFIRDVGIVTNSDLDNPDTSQGVIGPFTYVPKTSMIYVDCVSGGGGGGGGHASGGGGGGGAHSGCSWKIPVHVRPGVPVAIIIGAGGAGGAIGSNGGNGGATTISQQVTTGGLLQILLSTSGGLSGYGATSANGGAGAAGGYGAPLGGAGGVSANGASTNPTPSRTNVRGIGTTTFSSGGGGGALNFNGGSSFNVGIAATTSSSSGGTGGASGGGGGGGACSIFGRNGGGTGGSNGAAGSAPASSTSYGAGGGGGSGNAPGGNGNHGYLAITENF